MVRCGRRCRSATDIHADQNRHLVRRLLLARPGELLLENLEPASSGPDLNRAVVDGGPPSSNSLRAQESCNVHVSIFL